MIALEMNKVSYREDKSVTAVMTGFLMTDPAIRKITPFCEGLGNAKKGIVSLG